MLITCHATINNNLKHESGVICQEATEKDDSGKEEKKDDKEFQPPLVIAPETVTGATFFSAYFLIAVRNLVIYKHTPPPDMSALA